MKDCDDDIKNYHEDEVRLDSDTRKTMRGHRNANRDRLKRGLEKANKPKPDESVIQGSYAMKTTTQHQENDYDIDDGAAFNSDKLTKEDGTEMTPLAARQMVRDALIDGGGLRTDPVAKRNCVRVEYAGGYHVDIPVYRRILDSQGNVIRFELASGDEWRESNPREITEWFVDSEKKTKSEDEEEPQLRRLVRLFKKYSRANLDRESLSGIILTIVGTEAHQSFDPRDDLAFRNLLSRVKNRLGWNREVRNPAKFSEVLTKEKDGPKIDALIKKLGETLQGLNVLDKPGCTMTEARAAWDKTFKTDYFGELQKDDEAAAKGPFTPSVTEPEKKAYIRGPQTAA